jgi:peptide/nickel transport system substrate-binding protein
VTVTAAVPRSAAAVGEALRTGLAPAGFRVLVTAVPDAAYYATVGVAARQADLVLYAWSPDWLTGSAVIPPLFTCAALTATANHNVAQHCDPGFDRQVDIALGTLDDDDREAMWRALDRRLVEEALVVPRSFGVATALVGPAVRDAEPAVCFGGMVDLLRVRLRS